MATYKIVSQFNGLVLDVPGFSPDDGTQIEQYRDNGGMNQHWELVPVAGFSGEFKIVSQSSGKVLDVPGGNIDDKQPIQQHTDLGPNALNQRWQLILVNADGITFTIVCIGTGKALDIPAFSKVEKKGIEQYHLTAGTNQHWQLIRVS